MRGALAPDQREVTHDSCQRLLHPTTTPAGRVPRCRGHRGDDPGGARASAHRGLTTGVRRRGDLRGEPDPPVQHKRGLSPDQLDAPLPGDHQPDGPFDGLGAHRRHLYAVLPGCAGQRLGHHDAISHLGSRRRGHPSQHGLAGDTAVAAGRLLRRARLAGAHPRAGAGEPARRRPPGAVGAARLAGRQACCAPPSALEE